MTIVVIHIALDVDVETAHRIHDLLGAGGIDGKRGVDVRPRQLADDPGR